MDKSEDIFEILCKLSRECDKLADNVIVHNGSMLPEKPPEGILNILHGEPGYDLRIVLSPCPDTAYLNCNYPCVIITPPYELHYPAAYMTNPGMIYMGSFTNDFAIMHKSGINVLTPQMYAKLILRNHTPQEIVEGLCELASAGIVSNSERCRCSALLLELFALSFQILELTKDSRRPYGLTDAAMAIIKKDYYDQKLSATQVAAQLGVTPNYLAALFKKAGLLPLKKVIVQIRLEKAKAMLEKKKYSIKEVAYMTGWDNQFYFSNSFLEKYGVRPSNLLLEET